MKEQAVAIRQAGALENAVSTKQDVAKELFLFSKKRDVVKEQAKVKEQDMEKIYLHPITCRNQLVKSETILNGDEDSRIFLTPWMHNTCAGVKIQGKDFNKIV